MLDCEECQLPEIKIGNIRENMRNIIVTGQVTKKGDVRDVTTRYGPALVSWATIEDETGSTRLNLWRESQINAVRVGDTVRLVNAFVKTFGESLELNIGRDGKIEVLNRREKL